MKPAFQELKNLCPTVDKRVIAEHLARLDENYFRIFSPPQIAPHLEGLARLSPENPVAALFADVAGGELECTVLACDYPAEFSLITGVLSAMGFNILSGDVFTYAHARAPGAPHGQARRADVFTAALKRRKIIDRFSGTIRHSLPRDAWKAEFQRRLQAVLGLLERGDRDAAATARGKVNEMVAGRLAGLSRTKPATLYPVSIDIAEAEGYTRLRVLSQDTPAFLYALSSALALQDISIERVRIRTSAGRIEDELDVLDQRGQPISDPDRLDRIRMSVLLTKQFTYFLDGAPEPYAALCRFEQLVEAILKVPERGQWVDLLSNPEALPNLARLLGASDYLWEDFIRLQYETLLPMLKPHVQARRFSAAPGDLPERLKHLLKDQHCFEDACRALNEFKDREIFLIDLDQILDPAPDVKAFAEAVTALAELVIRAAGELIYPQLTKRFGVPRTVAGLAAAWAVFGLGKFGGVAMGYASDIELLLVYSDSGRTDGRERIENAEFFERFARLLSETIRAKREGIFYVDLRLRPYGDSGPLACSLESFCRYYGPGGPAHSYERLALVRLRAVAGERELGARIERLRDEFVYAADSIDVQELRALRKKQAAEKAGAGHYNAKFSPGALVDLEYDTQILQVLHGRSNPRLRTPRLHAALTALTELGVLTPEAGRRLTAAYYFLRRLINGLRMLRGSARDLFLPPAGSDEFLHLARRMGYRRDGDWEPEQRLRVDFETHTAVVRAFAEHYFGRGSLPGPRVGNVADLVLSEKVPAELQTRILAQAGFKLPARAGSNLRRLAGAGERQTLFARLAVLACDTLRQAADPDLALNNWERFVQILPNPQAHFERLLSQPRRLDILLNIFSASQFLADTLIRNPEFLDWATDSAVLNAPRDRAAIAGDFTAFAAGATRTDWLNALRRFRRRELLRIGTRDICLRAPLAEITADLACLAEAVVGLTLERIWSDFPAGATHPAGAPPREHFCILAFGKLGGGELNYSSDIDLIGLCSDAAAAEPEAPCSPELFKKVLKQLGADLCTHTEEGYAYRVDFRLRPFGRAGQLVYSLASLEQYYREKAAPWEIQALLKARPVAGNAALGAAFLERARRILTQPREAGQVIANIAVLRAKALKSGGGRQPARDVKVGPGGIRDIEFLVQGLQLIHAARQPEIVHGNTLIALEQLRQAGLLPDAAARQLTADYVFLRRIEHCLQIFEDRQIHQLPDAPEERAALARRVLGTASDAEQFTAELNACAARVQAAYAGYLR